MRASAVPFAPERPLRVWQPKPQSLRHTEIKAPLSLSTYVCFVPGHCAWKRKLTNTHIQARCGISLCPVIRYEP